MPTDDPSSSLLAGLRGREPDAWQRFLHLYAPLVYYWCRTRYRLAPADAADVLQDVALRVVQSVGDYRGGNFLAWLAAITRSRVANHVQRNPAPAAGGSDARDQLAAIADPRAAEDEAPPPEEMGGVLQRALERVRARAAAPSWQAFWQVTVQGRQPADVAADLGLSPNAVYIANSRILCRLRAELGNLDERTDG
jgi:RNA polymerase sigma-70 factor (ECF subfamily)